jgi:hypothetical protein
MENNTKIAIGLAAAVVVGYIVYKSSKPKASAVNTKDPYLCPAGYKLTPIPMGRLVGEICKDLKGNTAEKEPNPNYVGTKEPNCICESYPCNCGGSKPDYGYSRQSKCTGEYAVLCNDGSCDVSNGIVAPCFGIGVDS